MQVEVDAMISAIVGSSREIFQIRRMSKKACCRNCGMRQPVLSVCEYGRSRGKGAKWSA